MPRTRAVAGRSLYTELSGLLAHFWRSLRRLDKMTRNVKVIDGSRRSRSNGNDDGAELHGVDAGGQQQGRRIRCVGVSRCHRSYRRGWFCS